MDRLAILKGSNTLIPGTGPDEVQTENLKIQVQFGPGWAHSGFSGPIWFQIVGWSKKGPDYTVKEDFEGLIYL